MLINEHLAIAGLFERARFKIELDSAAQSHLNSCDMCRQRLSWMEVAAELGPRELAYEPPADSGDTGTRPARASSRTRRP